jgi:hypothetical protein
MPNISELSETKDEILTIDLEEIETEELLLGKNIKKGVFISSVINEIIKEARIPKDVAELIALYGVDTSLEDWVTLTSWLPQSYKPKMVLTKICLLLTVLEFFQMGLEYSNSSRANYTPALFWPRFIMVPLASEVNGLAFLFNFILIYSEERTIKNGDCCSWSLVKMKNLSKLPLEHINEEKINEFVGWAKQYLFSSILGAKLVTPLFLLAIVSGLTSLVISFFSHNPPEDGVEITVKTTATIGITLAALGLYKNCQIKNRMLQDKSILTAKYPDFSK